MAAAIDRDQVHENVHLVDFNTQRPSKDSEWVDRCRVGTASTEPLSCHVIVSRCVHDQAHAANAIACLPWNSGEPSMARSPRPTRLELAPCVFGSVANRSWRLVFPQIAGCTSCTVIPVACESSPSAISPSSHCMSHFLAGKCDIALSVVTWYHRLCGRAPRRPGRRRPTSTVENRQSIVPLSGDVEAIALTWPGELAYLRLPYESMRIGRRVSLSCAGLRFPLQRSRNQSLVEVAANERSWNLGTWRFSWGV